MNFSATWCGPCKVIAPFYRELSEKYPSLMFVVVDVDELPVSDKIILCTWQRKLTSIPDVWNPVF